MATTPSPADDPRSRLEHLERQAYAFLEMLAEFRASLGPPPRRVTAYERARQRWS